MKLRAPNSVGRAASGILLFECVVYLGLLFLVLGLSYKVFYRGWEQSLGLRRNAEQIARALTTGERWREDVRTASGPLRAETAGDEQILHIPHRSGEVAYRLEHGTLWRRASEQATWAEVLDRVKSSRMQPEPRQHVTAWRWELELKTREPKRRLQPLLTFEAVPATTPLPQ
ncbi:MAG: hypothetical protein JWR69_382 [Pedosphaera sp.]|nr:hypothetical protein [Pedosphaera sp.]